jgi:hypothetical protein
MFDVTKTSPANAHVPRPAPSIPNLCETPVEKPDPRKECLLLERSLSFEIHPLQIFCPLCDHHSTPIHWNQSRCLHALGGETCCSICVVNISESKLAGERRPRQGRCWRARDAWVNGIDGGSWNYIQTLLYFDCLLSDFISVFAIWISYLLFYIRSAMYTFLTYIERALTTFRDQ